MLPIHLFLALIPLPANWVLPKDSNNFTMSSGITVPFVLLLSVPFPDFQLISNFYQAWKFLNYRKSIYENCSAQFQTKPKHIFLISLQKHSNNIEAIAKV